MLERKAKVIVASLLIANFLGFAILVMTTSPVQFASSREKRDRPIFAPKTGGRKYMEFDDFFNGKFESKSFYPNWVSGDSYVTRNASGAIEIVQIETGIVTELFDAGIWNNVENAFSWSVSADQQFIAIYSNLTDGYAHYVNTFSVDVFDKTGNKVFPNGSDLTDNIQKLKWSTAGHDFAYVYQFDVYMVKGLGSRWRAYQLTDNGNEHLVFNGVTDQLHWVEITDDDALLWWSPDGQYLAYASIFETNVGQCDLAVYGDTQYPKTFTYPYPKPGTPIPHTTIRVAYVFNASTDLVQHDVVSTKGVTEWVEYYLNSAEWIDSNTFAPTWKNRIGNKIITDLCTVSDDFVCTTVPILNYTSTTGWVGHYKPSHIFPVSNNTEYFTTQSNEGFPHLGRFDVNSDEVDYRTSGQFEVTDTNLGYNAIFFYDPTSDYVYFTSTESVDQPGTGIPRIRHLWQTKARGSDKTRLCISCDYNTVYKDRCNWVTPTFSRDGTFVVINCGGTANGAPISLLLKNNGSGKYDFLRVQENNDQLLATLEEYHFRIREYGTIKLPGYQQDWFYALHKPPNFDPSKKYPMLVQVYSGPGWQHDADYYQVDWARGYVASSNLDVVVMTFDGRGTGYRGDEIMHMIYHKLGYYEPLDQIEAARQVSNKFDYIDESRIAIWGRSYGGYVTSLVMAEDSDPLFKCGLGVAPVTDWKLYQTLYTERFMDTLNNNMEGYTKSSAVKNWENYAKHYYVIVHGTSDENVHIQNSAHLSNYLIKNNVNFGNYFAADEFHGFNRFPNSYGHHYKLLTHHLKICLNIE